MTDLSTIPGELQGHIFNALDSGLLVFDRDFRLVGINSAAEEMLFCLGPGDSGAPAAELFGDVFPTLEGALNRVLKDGKPEKILMNVLGRNQTRLKLNIAINLRVLSDGTQYLVLTLHDVTEQMQLMMDRSHNEKMAAVGLLAAGIAHEFNNIWASVQGYAELADQNESFQSELVNVCLEQADRASEIVHALLSFSDLRVDIKRGVSIGKILSSIKRIVDLELQAKGITLVLDIKDDPLVSGNEGMLQQVFLNLAVNAYQAITGRNGEVHVSLCQEGRDAVIRVKDNGCGMSEEQLLHLYEPFYTTKGAFGGKDEVDGHGLGLTLTHNLVSMHGGEIEVNSHVGAGSEFTVRLPISSLVEDPVFTGGVESMLKKDTASMKILLVEDEVLLQRMVCQILTGHKVVVSSSGEEALNRMSREKYDLVMLDIVLAGKIDGLEVYEKIKSLYPGTPMIFVTGRTDDKRLKQLIPEGIPVVYKPFSVKDLLEAIPKSMVAC